MNKAKYEELFAAFGKAPMKEFLELLFECVPPALKKRLIIEDVSYHRHNAEIVTLEAPSIKNAAFLQNCRILAIFAYTFASVNIML